MPKLRLTCPECEAPISTELLSATAWKCRSCGAEVPNPLPGQSADQLTQCRACGNPEMYVQKAFPNWLGMGIVVVASLGFLVFHWMYWFYAAWSCLFAAAILDTLLYFLMGNVTVCYRCRAEHFGFPANQGHGGFDLGIAEKYRQERLRKQLLRKSSASFSAHSKSP